MLALAACFVACAADAREPTAMRFDHLTMADGLSQSSVMAVAQDHHGFMWFATESGLNRYDGYSIRRYSRERGNPGGY